ncbi:MAG: beta-propeller domain-containing protein, partial [archaeon]
MLKKSTSLKITVILAFALALAFIAYSAYYSSEKMNGPSAKTFASCSAMSSFIKTNSEKARSSGFYYGLPTIKGAIEATAAAESGASDYSTTNIQVAGVDEADIVKNDGKYIYTVTGNKIAILNAYPPENAGVVSEISFSSEERVIEMFVNSDKLVVFGNKYKQYEAPAMEFYYKPYYSQETTFVKIYDVSDRANPSLSKDIAIDGSYFNSRMIGDHVYVIVNSYVYENVTMPNVTEDGTTKPVAGCEEVQYFGDIIDSSYLLTTVMAVNLATEETSESVFLTGNSQDMYVSANNIYLTSMKYSATPRVPVISELAPIGQEETILKKLKIEGMNVEFQAEGSVPGSVLNQFSMDEYEGHFRIATTIRGYFDNVDTSTNNIYVLDENLGIVGKIEKIAPGESIYSARFMGDRAYLVTFRHVDPLFVIDLSDPANPSILGKLKIPGYSDYLHPYDETHLIGIGKEVDESIDADKVHTEGAVYYTAIQGVKISLFDVSDVANPVEMSKEVIGDRGTESLATSDHKAFLFDRQKGLLVVPITLAELKEGQNKSEMGEYTFDGAYVYHISLDTGLTLRARITHAEDESSFEKSGYYYQNGPYSIKRSLWMDDVLYTVSEKTVKANSLIDMSEITSVSL